MKIRFRLLTLLSCLTMIFSGCQSQPEATSSTPKEEEPVILDGEKLIVTDAISDTVSLYDYIPLNLVYLNLLYLVSKILRLAAMKKAHIISFFLVLSVEKRLPKQKK